MGRRAGADRHDETNRTRVWFREGDQKKFHHSNNIIIEMDDHLIVVDANFPSGAQAVLNDAKKISTKPIRYVIDTHHHQDHAYGNAVFTRAGAITIGYFGMYEEMQRSEPANWLRVSKGRKDVAEMGLDGQISLCSVHEIDGQLFLSFPAPRTGASGLDLFQRLTAAREFLCDGFYRRGPDERLRVLVPRRGECVDRRLQFVHATEHTSSDRLLIQVAEPTFNQIQPTGTGRDEVEHETRVTLKPGLHLLVLVGSIVAYNQVKRDRTRELLVQSM